MPVWSRRAQGTAGQNIYSITTQHNIRDMAHRGVAVLVVRILI